MKQYTAKQIRESIYYRKNASKFSGMVKASLGFEGEPEIVLLVHEAPGNECSERLALQKKLGCAELQFRRQA